MLIVSHECTIQLLSHEINNVCINRGCEEETTINIYSDLKTNSNTYVKVLVFDFDEAKLIYDRIITAVYDECKDVDTVVVDLREFKHEDCEKCHNGPELYLQYKQ